MQNPKDKAPLVCTWVNVKGKDIRSFLNNIYPALGQAKLELLKNHELARGYPLKPIIILLTTTRIFPLN
jgi:hypothetical protein